MIHHQPHGELLIHKFSKLDFRPHTHQIKDYLVDLQSETHLQSILQAFKTECGIDFKVIKVDSDGSCLPYAVSRCLIGKEILYDVLREALHGELVSNEPFYQQMFGGEMSDETWRNHFEEVCIEALPTRGGRTGRWLGPGEHLVGMANVLARPILLVDHIAKLTNEFDGQSCGMFLPSRLTREQVLARNNGRPPGPICIAWANEKRNHFVSLIRSNPEEDLQVRFLHEGFLSTTLSNAVELACFGKPNARKVEMQLQVPRTGARDYVMLTDSESGKEVKVPVPVDVKPGDSFQAKFNRPVGILELAWMRLLVCNAKTQRARAIKTLKLIVDNLCDAYLTTNFAQMDKVSKLKLDNAMVRASLIVASGAVDLLLAMGFEDKQQGTLEFRGFGERTVLIRDALRCAAAEVDTLGDLQGEVPAGQEIKLFGSAPCCLRLSWQEAREIYACDGPETSAKLATKSRETAGVWCFGHMYSAQAQLEVDAMMQSVRADFESLARNSELASVDWDDAVMFNQRLMHVQCPDCAQDQEWNGPVDGIKSEMHLQQCSKCARPLAAEMTGARKLLSFVGACAVDGTMGATRCAKCRALQIGKETKCNTCCSMA